MRIHRCCEQNGDKAAILRRDAIGIFKHPAGAPERGLRIRRGRTPRGEWQHILSIDLKTCRWCGTLYVCQVLQQEVERLEMRAAVVEEEAGRARQLEEEAAARLEQLGALQEKARALAPCRLNFCCLELVVLRGG